MSDDDNVASGRVASARARFDDARSRAERTVLWRVWDRMLEIEFVDRSVALAGKAFVSFFPLVIVIASFVPDNARKAIFSTMTRRLGVQGHALVEARRAFASSDDVRRATGILGLVLMIFFASSFTTALQRVYLRAWRRPPGRKASEYTRGPAWLLGVIAFMALMGGIRSLFGDGPQVVGFAIISLVATSVLWWFTAWFMLRGQVRWRVLVPSGVITGVTMAGYALSASIWMPEVVLRNQSQFGFFGVALALVTWFSGAAICILIGTCAGAVFAADEGWIGRFVRGPEGSLLVPGADPSFAPPVRDLRLRDAFGSVDDDAIES